MKSIRCLKAFFLSLLLLISLPAWAEMTLEEMKQKAEQGNAAAMFHLGAAYLYGNGVPKDIDKTIAWMEKAAEKGELRAMDFLMAAYHEGKVVPKDSDKARYWLSKLEAMDSPLAHYALGMLYSFDFIMEKDNQKSFKYLSKAYGKMDDPTGYRLLGDFYREGKVTPQSHVRSYIAYSIAAYLSHEKEDIEARDSVAKLIYGAPLAKAQEDVRVLVAEIEAFTVDLDNI